MSADVEGSSAGVDDVEDPGTAEAGDPHGSQSSWPSTVTEGRTAAGSTLIAAKGMVLRNLYHGDPDAIRIFDPHLDQAPRFQAGRLDYGHAGAGQPIVLVADVADL